MEDSSVMLLITVALRERAWSTNRDCLLVPSLIRGHQAHTKKALEKQRPTGTYCGPLQKRTFLSLFVSHPPLLHTTHLQW
jgi:hypothetical protein